MHLWWATRPPHHFDYWRRWREMALASVSRVALHYRGFAGEVHGLTLDTVFLKAGLQLGIIRPTGR